MYTVKRIDEDLNFGCEERPDDAPVMAIVTLVDSYMCRGFSVNDPKKMNADAVALEIMDRRN